VEHDTAGQAAALDDLLARIGLSALAGLAITMLARLLLGERQGVAGEATVARHEGE
jgi:hypothetical protein